MKRCIFSERMSAGQPMVYTCKTLSLVFIIRSGLKYHPVRPSITKPSLHSKLTLMYCTRYSMICCTTIFCSSKSPHLGLCKLCQEKISLGFSLKYVYKHSSFLHIVVKYTSLCMFFFLIFA